MDEVIIPRIAVTPSEVFTSRQVGSAFLTRLGENPRP